MNVLLWLAWATLLAWTGREVWKTWSGIRTPAHALYAEIKTFAYVEVAILGSAVMRVVADQKCFYPCNTGFLGLGYTEAQFLCGFAWILAFVYSLRWGLTFLFAQDANVRWTGTCFYLILVFLSGSGLLMWVFDAKLGN